MKKVLVLFVLIIAGMVSYAATLSFSANTGDAELDVTLSDINVEAKADIGGFSAELSISSGVSEKEISTMITVEKMEPADVYFAVEMAKVQNIPVEKVVTVYKKNKGKGWGAVAKELGIKPGSKEFKALKGKAKEKKEKGSKKEKGDKKESGDKKEKSKK